MLCVPVCFFFCSQGYCGSPRTPPPSRLPPPFFAPTPLSRQFWFSGVSPVRRRAQFRRTPGRPRRFVFPSRTCPCGFFLPPFGTPFSIGGRPDSLMDVWEDPFLFTRVGVISFFFWNRLSMHFFLHLLGSFSPIRIPLTRGTWKGCRPAILDCFFFSFKDFCLLSRLSSQELSQERSGGLCYLRLVPFLLSSSLRGPILPPFCGPFSPLDPISTPRADRRGV